MDGPQKHYTKFKKWDQIIYHFIYIKCKGKSRERERLVVAWNWISADGYEEALRDDGNILKLGCVMVHNFENILKSHWIVDFGESYGM